MYSRKTRDSQIGLPLWTNTGTFLWTGLYFNRISLLLARSSTCSNLISFSFNAHMFRRACRHIQARKSCTSSAVIATTFKAETFCCKSLLYLCSIPSFLCSSSKTPMQYQRILYHLKAMLIFFLIKSLIKNVVAMVILWRVFLNY